MKNFFFPMKIPQKQVLLLAASLSLGQMAFPIGNNMSGEASAIAQQNRKQVTGTVTDSFGPVIGASVVVKGTTNGVITDMDGNFTLQVPVGATIVISYVGYKDKEIKRGYNQAELLSRRIALIFNLSHYPDMLIRSVDTLPQNQFTPQARLNNLKKAFRFNSRYDNLVQTNSSLSVLLVDDIYTSGATMEACTRILLSAGIPNVFVLSICIGMARD